MLCRRMDKSGDGKLSEDEFIKVILFSFCIFTPHTLCQGAMDDGELMLMLDSLFESMTGSGFLSQAEKTLNIKESESKRK